MGKFWKAALAVIGLGVIGALFFWSLYTQLLALPIFANLTPEQTFLMMQTFLLLTFAAFFVMIFAYLQTNRANVRSTASRASSLPDKDLWNGSKARLKGAVSKGNIGLQPYLQNLAQVSPEAVAVIRSHPSSEKILRDLYELHRSPRFPFVMSINGEFLDNPIYDKLPKDTANTLIEEYRISKGLHYRIMPEDLYLVKSSDGSGQNLLLQYFSGTQLSGWQTWLFPHGFQIHEPDLQSRLLLDARDFEKLTGLSECAAEIQYMPRHEYLLSFKPDFGYYDKLVAYCFLFCSVAIKGSQPQIARRQFEIAKGDHSRIFRWFYPEELQNDKTILIKNSDVVRGIHTLYGTSLVPVPLSFEIVS